jgi:hypothetical protein
MAFTLAMKARIPSDPAVPMVCRTERWRREQGKLEAWYAQVADWIRNGDLPSGFEHNYVEKMTHGTASPPKA